MDVLHLIACFPTLLLLGLAAFGGYRWAIKPLEEAAKERRDRVQFGLAEMLCLFIPVQLQLGVTHWLMHYKRVADDELLLQVGIAAVTAFAWYFHVRMLCHAGVKTIWHRCVVVMAAPLFGWTYAILISPALTIGLLGKHRVGVAIAMPFVAAMLLGGLYAFGRFIRVILPVEPLPPSEPAADKPSGSRHSGPWGDEFLLP